MTSKEAAAILIPAGAKIVVSGKRCPRDHRGRVYVCSGVTWVMPASRREVLIFETPVMNGWQLGPDSLIDENMSMNAAAVADALEYEKVANVLELCP